MSDGWADVLSNQDHMYTLISILIVHLHSQVYLVVNEHSLPQVQSFDNVWENKTMKAINFSYEGR